MTSIPPRVIAPSGRGPGEARGGAAAEGAPACWAVYREVEHSPQRELDDALILQQTAITLRAEGFRVRLMDAGELPDALDELPGFLFHMCERPDTLAKLKSFEERGVVQINRPGAVLDAHRDRSLRLFARGDVRVPDTRVVATDAELPERFDPCWIKRTDHKTREGEVLFAETRAEAHDTLAGMLGRGIARAVLQRHVEGDLLKFYGVGREESAGERFFEWFYHPGRSVARHPFSVPELSALAFRAAAAVDLEVFGGDVVVDADGRLFLIDLNAWPSFALYRDAASVSIGQHLAARFRAVARC